MPVITRLLSFAGARRRARFINWHPGEGRWGLWEIDDLLVAYTDGITEAENLHGELWGQRQFETVVRSYARKPVEDIIHSILEEVSLFANGHPQRDDMTLAVMRVGDGCGV